jgi:exopolysaccharide biosynthesis polyprenyl glycosylphosphotransferase
MVVDILTVAITATVAIYFRERNLFSRLGHSNPLAINRSILLLYLAGFSGVLAFISNAHGLYGPLQAFNGWREQRKTIQSCLTAGLILAGTLYFSQAKSMSRAVVVGTVLSAMFLLCLRRAAWRFALYRKYERGLDTRNVLIVGIGPSGQVMRSHLRRNRHLGYTFKGFIRVGREVPKDEASEMKATDQPRSWEVLGGVADIDDVVRQHFIDEMLVTGPCTRGMIKHLIAKARGLGIDIRVVLDLYDGLVLGAPIEYVGQFPTMPLHLRHIPVASVILKRVLDLTISLCAIFVLSPAVVLIAVAIWIDSRGPIFYCAERIGRKGQAFKCWKFRTMVVDAEALYANVCHMNERDSVIFKMKEDPRMTRVGRFLRKYSLDELPQFFNVILGNMSIVGPRPSMAREVSQYKLSHLRRLEVSPGITGLWQIQGRQDPSFDRYISLDTLYVENWSLWLDFKIMMRTIGVVLSGTGL